MLSYLHIKNFALVEEMAIPFYRGLNVLTGETGAGKSIVINAISLLLGERASSEMIREGSDRAILEAIFSVTSRDVIGFLKNNGLGSEQEIVISREISKGGRNICRINGNLVPVNFLKKIGAKLVDMHGQFQNQFLLNNENQLSVLDELDPACVELRQELSKLIEKKKELTKKLHHLGVNKEERQKKIELLKFQINEIEEAGIAKAEEQELIQKLKILSNLERLVKASSEAYYCIYEGSYQQQALIDSLANTIKNLEPLLEHDKSLECIVDNLKNAEILLAETARELHGYTENLSFEPGERDVIESRLEIYRQLKQKYGGSLENIFSYLDEAKQELLRLENSAGEASEIEKALKKMDNIVKEKAMHLSKLRRDNASKLKEGLISLFQDIALQKAIFDVKFNPLETVSSFGAETIEFLFSANPGEPLKPLSKIVSGGEMSRLMLALKSLLAEKDKISTLVFDEIDSGIGGVTAQQIGKKLKETAKHHQVICVTHNPHIAARAHHQYVLYKDNEGKRTLTMIKKLEQAERVREIARMMGSINDLTLAHATSLLQQN
ncbi:MAG: DNA repair protein RecN [Firmicutes bacterium]|nr:DNA repair protein RecN [Bacillota bacterium]